MSLNRDQIRHALELWSGGIWQAWETVKDAAQMMADAPGPDYDAAQQLLDTAIEKLHGPGLILDATFIVDAAFGDSPVLLRDAT
jgi:TPR repeat protein